MNRIPNSFVVASIIAAFSLSACSSSDNDTPRQDSLTSSEQGSVAGPVPTSETDNDLIIVDTQDVPGTGDTLDDPNVVSSANFDLRTLNDDILLSLAGYELETLSEDISKTASTAMATAISNTALPEGRLDVMVQGSLQIFSVDRVQYNCVQGGTLVVESFDKEIESAEFTSDASSVTYIFDQCQLDVGNGENLSGSMALTTQTEIIQSYISNESTFGWQAFQWQQPSGQTIDITASVAAGSAISETNEESRVVSIAEYTKSEDEVTTGIQDASLVLNKQNGEVTSEYKLEANGTIIDPSGTIVTVETRPPVHQRLVSPLGGEESVPMSGQISFTADNGSLLVMTVKSGAENQPLVEITYTDTAGRTSILDDQPLIEINAFAD